MKNTVFFCLSFCIFMFSTGCTTKKSSTGTDQTGDSFHALDGTWEADYVSGTTQSFEESYPTKKPSITFDVANAKASGNSGCNNFTVAFTIDGNQIRFQEPAATKMACPGSGEAAFFKTLKTINKFSIDGSTLNLIMSDIAVMRLQRK